MKEAQCPIDKTVLSFSVKDNVRYCSSCRREFYPIQEQQTKTILEQYDLETVSEGAEGAGGEGPVLLSSDEDLRAFPFGKDYHRKNKDYLAQHFPNCRIQTNEYQQY